MNRIERDARRLCRVDGWGPEVLCPRGEPRWWRYLFHAGQLHTAGYTITKIGLDEASIEGEGLGAEFEAVWDANVKTLYES